MYYKSKKTIPTPPEIKDQLNEFKNRLLDMASRPDETSEFDAESVRIIMEDLSELDRSLLFTVYGVCDGSYSRASNIWQASPTFVRYRLNRALKYIAEHNDTPRTTYNLPRQCDID